MSSSGNQPFRFRFWRRSNDDPAKTLIVALLVAFVCALMVSATELLLLPKRQANIAAQREVQMASMLASLPGLEDLLRSSGADSIETRLVDLNTGQFVPDMDIDSYDQKLAMKDPAMSIELNADVDVARLGRRANYAPVNLLYQGKELKLLILPVHGRGYQSVLYAWLALAGDLNTIQAFSIIEQGETPGLGTRIEDPEWLAQFNGRQLHDATHEQTLTVVKGKASNLYEIDGISGATRTGDGINNLLTFWLSDVGFGPFLDNLKKDQ